MNRLIASWQRHLRAGASIAGVVIACLPNPAHAGRMFVWVDDRGVTNLADSVPETQRRLARTIEWRPFDAGPVERRLAPASGVATSVAPPRIDASPVEDALPARPRADLRPGPPPTLASRAPSDCAEAFRAYHESQACFQSAPKTISGGVNAARTPWCRAVVDPSPRCGIPVLSPHDRPVPILQPEDGGRVR